MTDVRLESLRQLSEAPPTQVPEEVTAARDDPDPRVRAAALGVVAAIGAADAVDVFRRALRDESSQVRHAAMRGLGRLRDDRAQTLLHELWDREPEVTRVALVEALAARADLEGLLTAADDPAWQVRAAAAAALGSHSNDRTVATLTRLVGDPSPVVQSEALATVADWPLERAATILFAALEKGGIRTRRDAQKLFATHWLPMAEFDIELESAQRSVALAELRQAWVFHQPRELALAVSASSADTESSELDAILLEIESASLAQRRAAAHRLEALAERGPLGPDACHRLAQSLSHESDPHTWRSALEAVAADASPEAEQLTLLALGHSQADVRRRACELAAAHGFPAAAGALREMLADEDRSVARAAAVALGRCGALEDSRRFTDVLTSADGPLRIAAARSLVAIGSPQAIPALERLSHDNDLNVRLAAVRTLGELPDPAALGTLVTLLDEPHGVGQSALASLRTAAESAGSDDLPPPSRSHAADVAACKAWWQQRSSQR